MSFIPSLSVYSSYKDRRYEDTQEMWQMEMDNSSTLYVGNLSFYTTEEQIYALFSMCGDIKRVIMGLDSNSKTPCGFCFVEYYTRDDALGCLLYINGSKLDERIIRTDIDPGFRDGRQYGRGKSGGQVRDEFRTEYDAGRGGFGANEQRQRMEKDRGISQMGTYDNYVDLLPRGSSSAYGVDNFGRSVGTKRVRDDHNRGRFDSDED